MNFKTNEELREIWESENFRKGKDDKLFVLAFDRHDIHFSIYNVIRDMGKPKTLDEILRLYSKFMKDFISESEAEIKKSNENNTRKYSLYLDSAVWGEGLHLVIYQKKDFEDFVFSYNEYKQKVLKREKDQNKRIEKKRKKDYELYLKLKKEFEHEGC